MLNIIIRFITESDFVSAAIREVTFSEFSHVEIGTPEGTWIGAHASGGVEERAADYCIPTFERRYAIPVTQEQYDKGMAYARSQVGTPYDFRDILGLLFHHDLSTHGHLICSWFVFDFFLEMDMQVLNVLPMHGNKIDPDKLHLAPIFIGKCFFQTETPE
jgi:uncharacterized protein YycO